MLSKKAHSFLDSRNEHIIKQKNEKTSKIYEINLNYLDIYSIYVVRGEKVYIDKYHKSLTY